MNERRISTNPSSNPPGRRRGRSAGRAAGFTPQQILILILVALLGSGVLALAAVILFSTPQPASTAEPPAAQAALPSAALPATWTPQPAVTQGLVTPGAPTATLLPVPASCAQQGSESRQGVLSGVSGDGTLEVLADGQTLLVTLAGVEVLAAADPAHPGATAEQTEQRLRELLENKPVILVADAAGADASGRLPRYVFAGGHFINYELVRDGLAQVDADSSSLACAGFLQSAEEQARADHIGAWLPTPVPTMTFIPFVPLEPDQNGCDCSKRYTCEDFSSHSQAQACYNACNDYNSALDSDRDGIACEGLP